MLDVFKNVALQVGGDNTNDDDDQAGCDQYCPGHGTRGSKEWIRVLHRDTLCQYYWLDGQVQG